MYSPNHKPHVFSRRLAPGEAGAGLDERSPGLGGDDAGSYFLLVGEEEGLDDNFNRVRGSGSDNGADVGKDGDVVAGFKQTYGEDSIDFRSAL